MPINVVCPGCKKRFTVSEKFAGQEGPCPKCKEKIKIPELGDEVVVHAPEDGKPKDSKGRKISKPILREETKFSPKIAAAIAGGVVLVLVLANNLRDDSASPIILALGALLLALPLVLGGYSFLRNDELEAYVGKELLVRALACGVAYAFLWGVYWWIPWALELENGFELRQLLFILPPLVMAGGFAAFASLDLDFSMGLVHYGFYVLATAALCFVMGVPLFAPVG
ncbi:MAG: hypothetical protein CMJ64_19875 [Planctomycetaceae bacterium]|nr:hypothetical protein [Planctomycetaceae bacterium]